MTGPVTRQAGSSNTLQRDSSDPRYQAAVHRALQMRAKTEGRAPGSHGYETAGVVQRGEWLEGLVGRQGVQNNGQFADPDLIHPGDIYFQVGPSPVTAQTEALIDEAVRFDRDGAANAPESTAKWAAVRDAIAGEIRQALPARNVIDQADPSAGMPVTPALKAKVTALNQWALGTDRLAVETQAAMDKVDGEIRMQARDRTLDETIAAVKGNLHDVEEANEDHSWLRQGWDAITGGGAGDDFKDYLEDKIGELETFDASDQTLGDAEYGRQLQEIMGNYGQDFQDFSEDLAESDETWHTVEEVGRVAVAATVGIVTTAATGGNFVAGFAAGLGTYELIDVAGDVKDVVEGDDVYADGHSGILTGLADMAGVDGDAGITREHLKSWGKDNAVDAISSVSVWGGTAAGMKTSMLVGTKLAGRSALAVGAPRALTLGERVLATSAGGTTGQAVNGAGQLTSEATALAFDDKLFTAEGGDQLLESARTQGVYIAVAAPTAALAGAIPIYRVVGNSGAALPGARSLPGAAPAMAAVSPATRLNWPGLGAQLANDTASNVVGAYLVDGDISKTDAISAAIGAVPGTAQNIAAKPPRGHAAGDERAANDPVTGLPRSSGPSGGGIPVRYVAHIEGDGTPSLGLVGRDGRTTADVNAPWMGERPSEVHVLETSPRPDGRAAPDAVHRLTLDADGTYRGVRLDADGSVTRYTTGGPAEVHPLGGIQLFNRRAAPADGQARPSTRTDLPAAPGRSDPASPAQFRPAGDVPQHARAEADLTLRMSALDPGDSWGVTVREIDPNTNELRTTTVHENELVFFEPSSRTTSGRSSGDGSPALTLEDGARVFNSKTNKEYAYSADRQRFEPLTPPAGAQLYFNARENVTLQRNPDGAMELFGRGDNTEGAATWRPTEADAAHEPAEGVDWRFDEATNRSYEPDAEGNPQPLDPAGWLVDYNADEGVSYLLDPATGDVAFFGQGDNRAPDTLSRQQDPAALRRAADWVRAKTGDKRLGATVRAKTPGIPGLSSGTTISSAGRSYSTKTGREPQDSVRVWEIRNAPLSFLTGYSTQEAFQFKASTFRDEAISVLKGEAADSPFNVKAMKAEMVGPYERDPGKTVVEISLGFELKTADATLKAGERDYFGARGPVRSLPHGIPFNKVMAERKVSLPLWARGLIFHKLGVPPEMASLLMLKPGMEDRPELSIDGLPAGVNVSEQFVTQVQAALGQTRLKLQVVTDDPAALQTRLADPANLADLNGLYDAAPHMVFVESSGKSGMRLSSVTTDRPDMHMADLTGQLRDVMNPSQMNQDVVFNTRASPDYWLDRAIVWPAKKALASSPLGQRWYESRFGGRLQPQPHYQPGQSVFKSVRDAKPKAERRVTASITPVNFLGLLTAEMRGASKTRTRPGDVPRMLNGRHAHEARILRIETEGQPATNVAVPAWLADLVVKGRTGRAAAWPVGGKAALEPLLDHWQTNPGMHPERVQSVIDFRQTALPGLREGNYVSPAQLDAIVDFLATQG